MNVGELKKYLNLVLDDDAEVLFKNGCLVSGIDVLDCTLAGDARLSRIESNGKETVLDKRTKNTLYLVGGLYQTDKVMCMTDSISAIARINSNICK